MLKYKIALLNVWWVKNGEDTMLFENRTQQNTYFNGLASGKFSPLANFNMGDNIKTSIYFKDTTNRTPEDLCRCNYAMVVKYDLVNEVETEIERRYFFAKCSQDSNKLMFVQLDLDDIQTNYIYKNLRNRLVGTFKRSHLNRFIDNGNGTVKFSTDNKIYEEEDFNFNKRLTKRTQLKFNYQTEAISNWLNNYVDYWVYNIIDPNHRYKVRETFNDATGEINLEGSYLKYNYFGAGENAQDSETGVIYYPVFKNNGKIRIYYPNDTDYIDISAYGEKAFRSKNSNTSYYFTKKCSMILKDTLYNETNPMGSVSINGNILSIHYTYNIGYPDGLIYSGGTARAICTDITVTNQRIGVFCGGISGYKKTIDLDFTLDEDFIFNKDDIIGDYTIANQNLEKKINSINIKYLSLCTPTGDNGTYNKQRINTKNIKFLYDEPLLDDTTRYYGRLKSTGLYSEGTENNYTGVSGNVDNSLAVINSAFANYIANNKNYALQNASNIWLILTKSNTFAPKSLQCDNRTLIN